MKTLIIRLFLCLFSVLILFSCSKSDTPPGDDGSDLYRIPESGIIYVTDFQVHVMNVDGSDPRKISRSDKIYGESFPSSSPDGKKIVFVRNPGGIVVQDNSGEKILMDAWNNPIFTTWSGNSTIYYSRWAGLNQYDKIYVYSIHEDGTNDVLVSPSFDDISDASDENPSVSPDMGYVVFSTNRTANGGTILKMDLSTGSTTYLTYAGAVIGESVICPASHPSWSPDGSKIAFSAYPGYPDFSAKEQIYVMNADGSGKTQLTIEVEADCSYPSWSPDGTMIVFEKEYPNFEGSEIWIMDASGANSKGLTDREVNSDARYPCFIGKPR